MNGFSSILDRIQVTPSSETTTITSVVSCASTLESNADTHMDMSISRALLIGCRPEICQGIPIIRGTRIAVANIVELHHLLGWSIQRIRDEYSFLNEEQIFAALEYYDSHSSEIDSYLQEETEVDAR